MADREERVGSERIYEFTLCLISLLIAILSILAIFLYVLPIEMRPLILNIIHWILNLAFGRGAVNALQLWSSSSKSPDL